MATTNAPKYYVGHKAHFPDHMHHVLTVFQSKTKPGYYFWVFTPRQRPYTVLQNVTHNFGPPTFIRVHSIKELPHLWKKVYPTTDDWPKHRWADGDYITMTEDDLLEAVIKTGPGG